MSETYEGNGHHVPAYTLEEAASDVGALDMRLSEVEASNLRLLELQEAFQKEVVANVSAAVATLLEERLGELKQQLATLSANVLLAVRRP